MTPARKCMTTAARFLPLALVAALAPGCVEIASDEPRRTANGADRAYVDAMITHHQTTIEMARLARTRGATRFVRRVGRRVVDTRTMELDLLNVEEESMDIAGVPRVPMPTAESAEHPAAARRQAARLRGADGFDAAFVNAMIEHQQHDIEMSRFVLERGRDEDVRKAARRIARDRRRQMTDMRRFVGRE